jgi:hypothetical protein
MTDNQKEVVFAAFIDLEMLVQDYRKAVLWLTQGNHKATPSPSVQVRYAPTGRQVTTKNTSE